MWDIIYMYNRSQKGCNIFYFNFSNLLTERLVFICRSMNEEPIIRWESCILKPTEKKCCNFLWSVIQELWFFPSEFSQIKKWPLFHGGKNIKWNIEHNSDSNTGNNQSNVSPICTFLRIIALVILEQSIKCYPNSLSYCASMGILHLIFFPPCILLR